MTNCNFKTQSSKLLSWEINDFQSYSNSICQSWIKAHKTQSLNCGTIQQYAKIAILLQDIFELVKKIENIIEKTNELNIKVKSK
jgi:hypothetical protein